MELNLQKKPYANKKFYVNEAFKSEEKNLGKLDYLNTLVTGLGDAEIIPQDRIDEANYVIVQNNDKRNYSPAIALNWNEFLQLITKEIDEKYSTNVSTEKERVKSHPKETKSPEKQSTPIKETPTPKELVPKKATPKESPLKKDTPVAPKKFIDKKRKLEDEIPRERETNSDEDNSTRSKQVVKETKRRRSSLKK